MRSGKAGKLRPVILAAAVWGAGVSIALCAGIAAPVHVDDASLPDPARTPGDALKNAKIDDLCHEDNPRRVPSDSLCAGAFAAYGIPPERRFQYRCGFLVPLEIGGASTSRNVWPQPATEASLKDALDRAVRQRVCKGQVEPALVQRQIENDWVRTYRLYLLPDDPPPTVFETDMPGGDRTSLPIKTPPVTVPPVTTAPSGDIGGLGSAPGNQRATRSPKRPDAAGVSLRDNLGGSQASASPRRTVSAGVAARPAGGTSGTRRSLNVSVRGGSGAAEGHGRAK